MAAHVFALGVIAHFAADVHPGIVIGHKPCGVEGCLVDLAEFIDGLGVLVGIGALISQERTVAPCDIGVLERLGETDADLGIVDGGVVLEGLVEVEELLG